jgi:hypothetical protein
MLIDPGFGIELAAITASWVEALTERQTVGRYVEPDGSDADLGSLIDTLGVTPQEGCEFPGLRHGSRGRRRGAALAQWLQSPNRDQLDLGRLVATTDGDSAPELVGRQGPSRPADSASLRIASAAWAISPRLSPLPVRFSRPAMTLLRRCEFCASGR